METIRRIEPAAYLVSLMLIVLPGLDVLLTTLPLRAGDVAWRFGAAGALSGNLLLPLLGLALLIGVALVADRPRILKVLTISAGLTAALMLGIVLMFALDSVQLRGRVPLASRSAFDVASLVGLLKFALTGVAAFSVARAGRLATRREHDRSRLLNEGVGIPTVIVPRRSLSRE